MRTFHLMSIGGIVMATGLALGVSQASADAPTPTQLMTVVNGVAPYNMAYLTSASGQWDGYTVTAVVTSTTQNGTTTSQLWLVDSNMRVYGGTTIIGLVDTAAVSVVNGTVVVNAGIRNADGTVRLTPTVYDLVTGDLKIVAPALGPVAPVTLVTPITVPAAGGTGTTPAQLAPARTGNAGMLPAGNLGLQMALATAVAGAVAVARRVARQN
ncbi:MAG: hypothetical protein EPO65_04425 [Dehalococcoidia bacterium]|nr:MAG: hypothetical protein EPO65_04425 [Dehalococcoidia bacterium]